MPDTTAAMAIASFTDQSGSAPESHGVPIAADASTWATTKEASTFFHSSEWFIRKTCNKMAAAHVAGHPIKRGGWLIDIPNMRAYLESVTESAAENSCYLNSGASDKLRVEVDPDESWEWSVGDVA